MKNLSLEKICSTKKPVAEVIPEDGMSLQNDLIDKPDGKIELDDRKLMT